MPGCSTPGSRRRRSSATNWAAAASLSDHGLRLRPEQAQALADELNAVLDRWMQQFPADRPAEGAELVFVFTDVVPLTEWPL